MAKKPPSTDEFQPPRRSFTLARHVKPPGHEEDRRKSEMLLKDKVAVIYGAAGAVGGAVARVYAREGAKLFLTGRHQAPVEAVAREIITGGGSAETAEVDA